MNAEQFSKYLKAKYACGEAKSWARGKSWQEVYNTCHRGDWLLWLYRSSKCYDLQKITLAKGLCANTVRYLMKDERSLKAVDAAIAFGKGEISEDNLNTAAAAAYAAVYAAAYAATAAYAAASAATYAASAAAYADASATYAAAAASATAASAAAFADASATAAAASARKENEQKTADIVREVLPIDIWEF